MRLIDADELKEKAFGKRGGLIHTADIDEMPTIEERKTGKWIPDNRPGGGFWVCSCCKFQSEAFAADKLYKYCPVCGCRMDEGGQDGR